MRLKLHLHVPKLQEFALYAACDDITKHGMPGLTKPIPYPLYLRAISTFNDKHSNAITIKNIYDIVRQNKELELQTETSYYYSGPHVLSLISALDHAVDVESVNRSVITLLMSRSNDDPDAVIEFIHRFAARCMSSTKFEFLVEVMTEALKDTPCKSLRQVLLHYGGRFSWPDDCRSALSSACSFGSKEVLEKAIESWRNAGSPIGDNYMDRCIESADTETIKLMAEMWGEERKRLTSYSCINTRDLDVRICELLLSLGIIEQGHFYTLKNVHSVQVIQWFLDHQIVDRNGIMKKSNSAIVRNASIRGGDYREVLYYLIEQAHVTVPNNVLSDISHHHHDTFDLGVFDYVIQHGADVNAIQLNSGKTDSELRCPYLLRYWLDKGLTMNEYDTARFLENCCIKNGSLEWLRIAMSALNIDVREWLLKQPHGTLILKACSPKSRVSDRYALVQYLLDHGATVDSHRGTYIMSPIHEACKLGDIEIVSLLINHGADVNEVASNYRMSARETPLFIACYCDNHALVELLLSHGADTSFKSGHHTCNSVTNNREIKKLLKQFKQKSKNNEE